MNPFLMIQADMADAQTVVDTMAAVASPERITLWDMTLKGGWIMLVLAGLLALAIYIAVERYLALRQALKTENDTGSTRIEDVVATNLIDSESDTGSITLVACDAPTINLRNGTGSIRAELLSGKSYNVKSSTGSINVPDNYPEGGSLTAKTSTGSLRITVK